jgi:3'-phosphoadenosine 5'-phosphosulfate sulfotransferase (PAPS reductase)/FAD synthetase
MTPELMARLAGRRVVASISGGKDSATLSLYLKEQGIEHDRVFMDTNWEHPKTYEYLRGQLEHVVGPITRIRSAEYSGFADLVRKKGMFPYRTARFCTEELKMIPLIAYLHARMEREGIDIVNAVGIRREESNARAEALEWEWAEGLDCEVWRPLVTWTLDDVVAIHRRHGLPPNPLYLEGAPRVGCYPCIHAAKEEIARLPEERIAFIESLEAEVQAAARARAAAKGEELGNPPTFFTLRTSRAEGEKHYCAPIREVVAWARTARGGKQLMLLDNGAAEGCMRWGLCGR